MLEVIDTLMLPEKIKTKLRSDVQYILDSEIQDIMYIILFGSCARYEYKITSDIDLLIITKEETDRYLRGTICSELDALEGLRTDVVFYTKEQFDKADSVFSRQIKKDGVVLWKK